MTRRKLIVPCCRVCGCTDDRACDGGCSWVTVEKGSPPLCSFCSGTADDAIEVLIRIKAVAPEERPLDVVPVINAAIRRRAARVRLEQSQGE